jgi:hypothetical protein
MRFDMATRCSAAFPAGEGVMQTSLAKWLRWRSYRRWEKAVRLIGRRAVDIQAATGCSWEQAKARAFVLPVAAPRDVDRGELNLSKALRLIPGDGVLPNRSPTRPVPPAAHAAPETKESPIWRVVHGVDT